MKPRVAIGWLAGLLLAVGILLGNSQHSVPGSIGCGTAFTPFDVGTPLAQAECSDVLSGPRIASFSLAGVGVLALLYLGLTGLQRGPVKMPERVDES